MKYLNTKTLKTELISSDDNIISTDARVSNWYTKCPDGYKGEWINGTYTFVLIPPPTQEELDAVALTTAIAYFTAKTDEHISNKIIAFNEDNKTAFADINSFTKYALIPTSDYHSTAVSFITWVDTLWKAVRIFQATATVTPTDVEFQAVLDGVEF